MTLSKQEPRLVARPARATRIRAATERWPVAAGRSSPSRRRTPGAHGLEESLLTEVSKLQRVRKLDEKGELVTIGLAS